MASTIALMGTEYFRDGLNSIISLGLDTFTALPEWEQICILLLCAIIGLCRTYQLMRALWFASKFRT